jgi:hypothetical protein
MIQFSCSCGRLLQAPEGLVGHRLRCPICEQLQTVPVEAAARSLASVEGGANAEPSDLHFRTDEPSGPARRSTVVANYKAAWSFGLGLVAIGSLPLASVLAFSFGILAIVLAFLALRDRRRSAGRMVGLGPALAGVFLGAWALVCAIGGCSPVPYVAVHGQSRTQSANNLRQMVLALNTYCLNFNGEFPPVAGGPGIHPQLSWRVTLLPFMEEEELYIAFHLHEPWDSPHNKKLLERMPKTYVIPGISDGPGMTRYRAFVGDRAAFEKPVPGSKPRRGRRLADFPGGAGKTIFIAEAAEAVPWTKPDELEYEPDKPLPRLCDRFARAQVAMGNAAVQSIEQNISELELRKMIERAAPKAADDEAEK